MEAWRRGYYCRAIHEKEQAALREAQAGIPSVGKKAPRLNRIIG